MLTIRRKKRIMVLWRKLFVTLERKKRRVLRALFLKLCYKRKHLALLHWQRVAMSVEVNDMHKCFEDVLKQSGLRMLNMTCSRWCFRAVSRYFHLWSFIVMQVLQYFRAKRAIIIILKNSDNIATLYNTAPLSSFART